VTCPRSTDCTLKIWDLETGQEVRTLAGHSNWLSGVAVSPDGKHAVSASIDRTLRVWELETGRNIATFYCESWVECCAFEDNLNIVAGERSGRLVYLHLELPANA
jgi:WD40 repeat protein